METESSRPIETRASRNNASKRLLMNKGQKSSGVRSTLGNISNKQSQLTFQKNKKNLSKHSVKDTLKEEACSEEVEKDLCNHFQTCFTTTRSNIENIDAGDFDNPQLCAEYVNPIYAYNFLAESLLPVRKAYMAETSLRPKMRTILIDWLIQVHHRFHMMQETLYMGISVLDRFLQVNPVDKAELQLVGVTALHIAAKYEEMYAPEINDYVYVSDDSFTHSQVKAMEIKVLDKLEFNLGKPIPLHFLRRNSKAGNVAPQNHFMAKYLLELTLVDYDMCHVEPSKLGAAALFLSLLLMDGEWSETLVHYSRYDERSLMPVVCRMAKNLKKAPTDLHSRFIVSKHNVKKAHFIAKNECLDKKKDLIEELANRADQVDL